MIVINSQRRPRTKEGVTELPPDENAEYLVQLSETLRNVVSLKLTTVQIPTTWYTIAQDKGLRDRSFLISLDLKSDLKSLPINSDWVPITRLCSIDPGNYDYDSFCSKLTEKVSELVDQGYETDNTLFPDIDMQFTMDPFTDRMIVSHNSNVYVVNLIFSGNFNSNSIYKLPLPGSVGAQEIEGDIDNIILEESLGWVMGVRANAIGWAEDLPDDVSDMAIIRMEAAAEEGLRSTADLNETVNLYGPTYFQIAITDYTNISSPIVTINQFEDNTNLDLPPYFNSQDLLCNRNQQQFPISGQVAQLEKQNPRKLTNAQLYSINERLSQQKKVKLQTKIHSDSDIFAVIPLANVRSLRNKKPPEYFVDSQQSLQTNIREYYRPVNISKLLVKLLNPDNSRVALNGVDWSFTLIAEQIM